MQSRSARQCSHLVMPGARASLRPASMETRTPRGRCMREAGIPAPRKKPRSSPATTVDETTIASRWNHAMSPSLEAATIVPSHRSRCASRSCDAVPARTRDARHGAPFASQVWWTATRHRHPPVRRFQGRSIDAARFVRIMASWSRWHGGSEHPAPPCPMAASATAFPSFGSPSNRHASGRHRALSGVTHGHARASSTVRSPVPPWRAVATDLAAPRSERCALPPPCLGAPPLPVGPSSPRRHADDLSRLHGICMALARPNASR